MPKKDPKRWQEILIRSPFATLTKEEVHNYYRTPEVQQALLDAVGKREAVIRQSFSPYEIILRRKDDKGSFIHLTKKRLEAWNQKRLSEVHPTFGKKVDTLLVDIDPKEGVPWERTKQITETAAKALRSHDDVRDVSVQFSGNRGFYVRGHLDNSIGVDRARNLTKRILGNLAQRPDVSLGTKGRIRLDTTPLKVRGSVRAPFSLDARTGLVSAPVKLEDLGKVKKKDFTIDKIMRKIRKKQAGVLPNITEWLAGEKARKIKTQIPNIVATFQDLVQLAKMGEATVGGDVRDDTSASRVNWDDPLIEDSKGSNTLPTGIRYHGPERWLESIQSGNNREAPVPQEAPMDVDRLQGLPKEAAALNPAVLRRLRHLMKTHGAKGGTGHGIHGGGMVSDVGQKKEAAEFAPGIPKSRKIHKLPTVKKMEPEWMLAIQKHKARKAGTHFDLRLVQPLTDRAHSWAIPKARLPGKKDKMLLAIQQATHKRDYALNFTGTLPTGYGAGTVTMPIKEKVKMLKMSPDRVKFERPSGEVFNMFRTKDDKWGIKRAAVSTIPQRIELGTPAPTSAVEQSWYTDPNMLKLLTVKGFSEFLRKKLLDSDSNID